MDELVERLSDARASDVAEVLLDDAQWSALVSSVRRQMRSLVGAHPDLEDLTQSALEQVLRALTRFDRRSQLSTYTFRICANVAVNHFRWWRRWLRRFALGTERALDPVDGADPGAEAVAHESSLRLHRALDRLSPERRIVLVLSDLEELPASRVAEIVQTSEGTVRSRLRKARLELAAILQRDPYFRDRNGEEQP